MENRELLIKIMNGLNDNRSKLSALYSLYNSSILVAEEDRQSLSGLFEQMIDFKNDLSMISNEVYAGKKTANKTALTKNKSKIIKLTTEAKDVHLNFNNSCKRYQVALKECAELKSQYKKEISELCKEFKSLVEENEGIDPIIIKGYKQQIKIIKAILDKIEVMVSDYNIKRNRMEEDKQKFTSLYESVNEILTGLKSA